MWLEDGGWGEALPQCKLQALRQGWRRGCGLTPVAWMPGLIILRHLSALRVLRRDQARLQHDVTPSPIRVLADFILTQPATPDIRIQNWAPWAHLGTTD